MMDRRSYCGMSGLAGAVVFSLSVWMLVLLWFFG